jgi:hypothetical protein
LKIHAVRNKFIKWAKADLSKVLVYICFSSSIAEGALKEPDLAFFSHHSGAYATQKALGQNLSLPVFACKIKI